MKTTSILVAAIALTLTCALAGFCQTRTTPVEVTNSPEVVVANTPDVNVSNSPTVKIDPNENQVTAAGRYQLMQFWTTDQTLQPGSWLWGNPFSCAGFRELRFTIITSYSLSSVKVLVQFQYPDMSFQTVGTAFLGNTTNPIAQGSEFTQASSNCLICIPAMSNVCRIVVINDATVPVTIRKSSAVYMVD